MKITAPDLLELGLIDEIVPEPPGGAHNDPDRASALVDQALSHALATLMQESTEERLFARYEKFRRMGREGHAFIEVQTGPPKPVTPAVPAVPAAPAPAPATPKQGA